MAARWNGRAVPFDRLDQALIDADLVISTTAAAEPIVTLEQYVRVQRARRNRLSLILDIAIPRDFDPRIGEPRPGDALPCRRAASAGRAEPALEAEGDRPGAGDHRARSRGLLLQLRHQRDVGLLLEQLGNHADQIRQRELSALYSSRPDLTEADREAIAHMAIAAAKPVPPPPQGGGALGRDRARARPRASALGARVRAPHLRAWVNDQRPRRRRCKPRNRRGRNHADICADRCVQRGLGRREGD